MSSERPEEFTQPVNKPQLPQITDDRPGHETAGQQGSSDNHEASDDQGPSTGNGPRSDQDPSSEQRPSGDRGSSDRATSHQAVVLVRGETISDTESQSQTKDSSSKASSKDNKDSPAKDNAKDKEKAPRKEVSAAKAKLQSRLPALDDDADVGVEKDQVVTRDGKADLAFTGTLRASAAPSSAPKGKWQEYRIYETNGGKHVFSKVKRSVFAEDQDAHEAEVFEPSPSSVPSQLLRTARDLTRSRPLNWMDAAVAFFGYDPLAKALYRKVGGQFEEHIS